MDPRDDLDSLADGVDCAACGQFVPTDRIRVLARRDDIAFVEIHCPGCRSESLGIVIAGPTTMPRRGTPPSGRATCTASSAPATRSGSARRCRSARPTSTLVHDLLARGGLAALVGGSEPPAAGPGR